jgi:hypothetical protein
MYNMKWYQDLVLQFLHFSIFYYEVCNHWSSTSREPSIQSKRFFHVEKSQKNFSKKLIFRKFASFWIGSGSDITQKLWRAISREPRDVKKTKDMSKMVEKVSKYWPSFSPICDTIPAHFLTQFKVYQLKN